MALLSQVIGELWKTHEATADDLPVYLEMIDVPSEVTEFVCLEQIVHDIDESLINTALDV